MSEGPTHSATGSDRTCRGQPAADGPIRPQWIGATIAARLVGDPGWWLQEKFGGQHLLIRQHVGACIAATDQRGASAEVPAIIAQAVTALPESWAVEGVWDGDCFVAFDLVEFEGLDFRGLAYRLRLAALRQMIGAAAPFVQVAETARETATKAELSERLHRQGRKGVVLRRLSRVSAGVGDVLACAFPAASRSGIYGLS